MNLHKKRNTRRERVKFYLERPATGVASLPLDGPLPRVGPYSTQSKKNLPQLLFSFWRQNESSFCHCRTPRPAQFLFDWDQSAAQRSTEPWKAAVSWSSGLCAFPDIRHPISAQN